MSLASTYSYRYRQVYDLRTFIEWIRFIIVNFILFFIFLFLTVEEFEWATFSSRKGIADEVIDETPWNIKTLI